MFVIKPEDFIGKQFGHYHLIEFLKGGGFGLVYKAEHTKLHRKVALKLLKPELVADGEKVAAFEREASIIANLTHPKILDVYDYDVFHSVPFIVMPFIEQGSLLKLHPRGSRLNMLTIVSYVTQIAEALQYAHDQKIVHRDIKPDNVLAGKHGLLLTDFGIAITAHSLQSLSLQEALGTLPYMAPEQFEGQAQIWSDQYSLAVVVYEWFCGKAPFSGGKYFEFYDKHKKEAPPSFKLQGVEVLPSVEAVVMKALAKEAKDRFADMQAFATALDQASQQQLKQPVLSPFEKPPGTTMEIYRGHTDTVYSVAWSPDGKLMASGSTDGTVQVWEAATGNLKIRYKKEKYSNYYLDWSSGIRYFTKDNDGVQIWDGFTGKQVVEYKGNPLNGQIGDNYWSPDGKLMASSRYNAVEVWRAHTGERVAEFKRFSPTASRLVWSPDGRYIASSSYDNAVHVWKADTGERVAEFKEDVGSMAFLTWSPDGTKIVAGGRAGTGGMWEAINGKKILEFKEDLSKATLVVWSPDGKYIALAEHPYGDKIVHVLDAVTGDRIIAYKGHAPQTAYNFCALVWSPDGKLIASSLMHSLMQVWEAATGNLKLEYKKYVYGDSYGTTSLAWSPDGKYMASGSMDGTVHVWVAPK